MSRTVSNWLSRGAVLACGAWLLAAGPAAAQPAEDAVAQAVVSHGLPAAEQVFLRAMVRQMPPQALARMAALPPSQVHIAIADAATGVVHANRPEEAAGYTFGPDPRGRQRVLAGLSKPSTPSCVDPGFFGGSGPYRRIYTTCLPAAPSERAQLSGMSYFTQGTVGTACMAASLNTNNSGETAYLYLGGWSGTPSAPYGNTDAGLQYNYESHTGAADTYAPFMSVAYPGPHGYVTSHVVAFNCGTSASLTFYIYACTKMPDPVNPNEGPTTCLELDAQNLVQSGPLQVIIYPIPVVAGQAAGPLPGGWGDVFSVTHGGVTYLVPEAPCPFCVLKWMTTIAQKKTCATGCKVNYSDGSTFGATWILRAISCNAFNCTTGNAAVNLTSAITNCTEYPFWYGKYSTANFQRDCTNTPAKQKGLAQSITVSGYAPDTEADAISLTYKAPARQP